METAPTIHHIIASASLVALNGVSMNGTALEGLALTPPQLPSVVERRPEDFELERVRLAVEIAEAEAATVMPAELPALPPITLIIDAEAFGRAIATVLGEHLATKNVETSTGVGSAAIKPAKPTIQHARHLDVPHRGRRGCRSTVSRRWRRTSPG